VDLVIPAPSVDDRPQAAEYPILVVDIGRRRPGNEDDRPPSAATSVARIVTPSRAAASCTAVTRPSITSA
jgi:hypothetical protein